VNADLELVVACGRIQPPVMFKLESNAVVAIITTVLTISTYLITASVTNIVRAVPALRLARTGNTQVHKVDNSVTAEAIFRGVLRRPCFATLLLAAVLSAELVIPNFSSYFVSRVRCDSLSRLKHTRRDVGCLGRGSVSPAIYELDRSVEIAKMYLAAGGDLSRRVACISDFQDAAPETQRDGPFYIYKKRSRAEGETFRMSVNMSSEKGRGFRASFTGSRAFAAFRKFTVDERYYEVQDFDDVTGRITGPLWGCTKRRSKRL
jgi:hypothetical protein